MITKENYYKEIKAIDFTQLDASLQESKAFVDEITEHGKSWDMVYADKDIKEMVSLYFEALDQALQPPKKAKEKKATVKNKVSKKKKAKKVIKSKSNKFSSAQAEAIYSQFIFTIANAFEKNWFIHKGGLLKVKSGISKLVKEQDIYTLESFKKFVSKGWHLQKEMIRLQDEISLKTRQDWLDFSFIYEEFLHDAEKLIPKTSKSKQIKIPPTKKKTARQVAYEKAEKVETISIELKMIKRFVLMHDKIKNQNQIRLFINALQKAIVEKRIRKTSPLAKEINKIQDYLLDLFWKFKTGNEKIQINLDESLRTKYLSLVGKQTELYSVKLIKSYINLQGKLILNQKAKNLYNRIANAINGKKISKRDRYWKEIEKIMETLKSFVKKNTLQGELLVSTKELNGLNGIVLGCPCEESLEGVLTVPKNTIMNSTDIVNLNFEKLGFTGKWKKLIGDPSAGFRAMIFGKPKMGKSYLAVDFAGYLARNHGTALYVAREEGIDDTLQQKLKDKNVAHPDLYVSDYLPEDLSAYDFVFLDSVNKLGLTPEDLDRLDKTYPHTSFIEVFQTTKQGNFKGANEFQHDVDVVIEIPEKGKAVQFGRFNQGGELNIFGR
jgi:hypothetical protein